MGGIDDESVEALKYITQGEEDFVDEQCYTLLHKVVLGLSMRDLEESIHETPEILDTTDVMGRTPLGKPDTPYNEPAF